MIHLSGVEDDGLIENLAVILSGITTEADQFANSIRDKQNHIYLSGTLENPTGLALCLTSNNVLENKCDDLDNHISNINLTIALVWVEQSKRGSEFAKEFVTDAGYSLGKLMAATMEGIDTHISLNTYAECRNQGGFNCAHWLSDLFSGAFSLYDLSVSPIERNFIANFADAVVPDHY